MLRVSVPVSGASNYNVEGNFVRDSGTGEARVDSTIGSRFWDLADWWHSDTDGMSLDRESFTHTAYQRIVEGDFVRDSGTGEARVDSTIGSRFWDLADWWHSDTDGMSLDRESFTHTAYQRIVNNLGKAAIPYILQDLEERHGHWYDALGMLTGEDAVDAGVNGNLRQARKAWLRWGRTNHYI